MNPNYLQDPDTNKKIPLCQTMQAHTSHVWKNYVVNSDFKKILVIAHSAGGFCLENI